MSIPDPAKVEGDEVEQRLAFADVHQMIHQRLGIFANLSDESLDALALDEKLADTLRSGGSTQAKGGGLEADSR